MIPTWGDSPPAGVGAQQAAAWRARVRTKRQDPTWATMYAMARPGSGDGSSPGRGKLTPVGSLVGGVRRAARDAGAAAVDTETWRRAVGPRIARRARAGSLRGGVLEIVTATSAWAQELSLLAPELVARLVAEGVDAQSVRFRVGEVSPPRMSLAQPAAPVPPRRPVPTTLAERIARIDDPELREALLEAAERRFAFARDA